VSDWPGATGSFWSQICIPAPPKNPEGQTAPDETAPSCVSTEMQFDVGVPSVNDVLTSCACAAAATVSVSNIAAKIVFIVALSYTRRRSRTLEKVLFTNF
jgi:hypothetical protein